MNSIFKFLLASVVLSVGISSFWALPALNPKPEPSKEPVTLSENLTPVTVEPIEFSVLRLSVDSFGFVEPAQKAELISQAQGRITFISEKFVTGEFVKKDEILVELDNIEYLAAVLEAEAELAKATADLQVESARGEIAKSDSKRTNQNSPSSLSLREPQMEQQLAQVKAVRAGLERAKNRLEQTKIRAPFDGLISERKHGFGAYVGSGVTLGTILGTDEATVRLPLSDDEFRYLAAAGTDALVTFKSEYFGRPAEWRGKIVRNEGVIDRKSRLIYLVATVADPYQLNKPEIANVPPLRFGSYVSAKIQGLSLERAASVPEKLIIHDRLPIMTKSETLDYIPVNVVKRENGIAIVEANLLSGELVVTSNISYPAVGMKLRVANAVPADVSDDVVSHDKN